MCLHCLLDSRVGGLPTPERVFAWLRTKLVHAVVPHLLRDDHLDAIRGILCVLHGSFAMANELPSLVDGLNQQLLRIGDVGYGATFESVAVAGIAFGNLRSLFEPDAPHLTETLKM